MQSLITEISQKVRRRVEQLDRLTRSPECLDNEKEIDKAIEDVEELIKPINFSNSGKLVYSFKDIITCLEEAKSELESEEVDKIWRVRERINCIIQTEIPLVLKDDKE